MYLVISWKYILIFVGFFFLLLVQNTFCYLSEIYFVICWKYILLLPSPAPLKACNIFAAQFLYGRLWGIYSMMTDMTMKIMNVMMAVINIMMVTINQNYLNYDGDTDEDGDAAVAAAADDDDAVALALAAVDDDDDDDDDIRRWRQGSALLLTLRVPRGQKKEFARLSMLIFITF